MHTYIHTSVCDVPLTYSDQHNYAMLHN